MAPERTAKQVLYCTWPGGTRRPGRQAPSLPETYAALARKCLSREAIRARGGENRADLLALLVPAGSRRPLSWHALAQHRDRYHRVVDAMAG